MTNADSSSWDKLLRLIPGYDPFATAGDCTFDADAAQAALSFFAECITHVEGALAGKPFVLSPWQQAIVANVFGWKRPDGTRRYRTAFIFVPRKNGKTTLLAGMVLFMLLCDGERGAQIYSAAADRDQASLIYRQCKNMVLQMPELSEHIKPYETAKSLVLESMGSSYKAISAEANTKHGYNTHFFVVDELHAQPNRDLVDVLHTSMIARKQPLEMYITTSDFDRPSICNEMHEYASKIRDGIFVEPSFLPVIYEATNTDDWRDPKVWAKANPNMGVSFKQEDIALECKKAQDIPAYENTFKRLHLNIKTEQDVRWLQMDVWDKCAEKVNEAELIGAPCYAGLDLSSTTDISALVLYFPDTHAVLPYFWIPSDSAHKRERRDRVPYLTWQQQELIELTPGNGIDYQYIRRRINELKLKHNIQEIAYDPYNADQIVLQLQEQDGHKMIEFRQGDISMNQPCKNLDLLVRTGKLRHGGNPILRWMASNVTIRTGATGNIKMDKEKSTEKIDGMVALAMAIGRSNASTVAAVPGIFIL